MKAVILAGGLGKRLAPFTEVIPKPLLPVGESSVLEIQIQSLKKHGITEIFIATNYMSEYVEAFLGDGSKYGVKIYFSRESQPLGTCGPLSLLRDRLDSPFIVMNGDILTTLNYQKLMNIAIPIASDLIVVTKETITPFHFGRVISKGDFIVGVEEKPNFKLEVLAGIYVLKPAVLKHVPDNKFFGFDSLIQNLLEIGEPIAKYPMTEYWLDIGQMHSYQEAQSAYKEHFEGYRAPT